MGFRALEEKIKDLEIRYFLSAESDIGRESGLLADSVVMTDNLATVFRSAIDSKIGVLADMTPVDNALRVTLGL